LTKSLYKAKLYMKGYAMIKKLSLLLKSTKSKDMSKHRVYTTRYEDLCQ